MGGPIGGRLAGSATVGFTGGYNRYHDGQGWGGAIGGGLSDGIGFSAFYGALSNSDVVTGQSLGWSGGERLLYGTLGAANLAFTAGVAAYGTYWLARNPATRKYMVAQHENL